jgi:hypothetical protein
MVTMKDGYQEFEHLEFLEIWDNWICMLLVFWIRR